MLQLLAGDLVQLPRIPPTLHLPTSYGQCLCHQQANINLVEDQRPWCHVVAHAVWAVKAWSAHARCELSTCMVTSGRSRRYCSAACTTPRVRSTARCPGRPRRRSMQPRSSSAGTLKSLCTEAEGTAGLEPGSGSDLRSGPAKRSSVQASLRREDVPSPELRCSALVVCR